MIKIASWNIRGLNDPLKQHEVRAFVYEHKLACLALVESKVRQINMDQIGAKLLRGWKYFVNYDWDTSGRIWVLWNPRVVDIHVLDCNDQIVHASLSHVGGDVNFHVSFVYGSNDYMQRRRLWRDLQFKASLCNSMPWLLIGDFNAVRFRHERKGGSSDWPAYMSEFDEVVCNAGLEDLRFSGCLYTWHNARVHGHILCKLDRALVNAFWLSTFDASWVEFLPFGISDHSPVLVDVGVQLPKVRRPFKFFNHWVEFEEFFPLVEEVWKTHVDGYAMYRVYKKLKLLKEALRTLAFKKSKKCNILEADLRAELALIQSQIASGGGHAELLEQERHCLARLLQVTKNEESSIKQKSRVQWLKEGDSNSAFFFHSIKNRLNTNKILRIQKEDGSVIKEKELIAEEIVNYYKGLLGSNPSIPYDRGHELGDFISSSLSDDQIAHLVNDFSDDDIKKAMFSLHPNKAPGPDGYNAFFFQRTWSIVGEDVVHAVKEFFASSVLLKESNATIIALIPKTPNASKLKDFRPISCCNTIYKCITKLLAGRLKEVLPGLVNEAQAAFVSGRSIGDNILMAQELVRGYHVSSSSSSPRCAIKVDLMKAYDSVRWEFLWDVLRLFGFPEKFSTWIRACVSTSRFSVSINGELNGYFEGGKGLRQGDPISPYLFVLCMEVLSRILMKKAAESPLFRYHWRCGKLKITHLCFADDLMIFSRGDQGSVSVIRDALELFRSLSGLQANPAKSEVFLSGVAEGEKMGIIQLLGFRQGTLPVRYLGVPLISTKLKAADCQVLVDRIISRVKSWTNQFLSFAGRLQLIQSVLFSIQSFWCSHFILPIKVIKAIEGILRAFLWKGSALDKHGAKVAWEEVSRPKEEGGLGIKKIRDWNMACMTRFLWSICLPSTTSLWAVWVRRNLLQKDHFWVAKVPWNCSWTWRKILKLREKVRPFISMRVGDGCDTSLWFEAWMPRGPICTTSQARVIYDSGLPKDALVKDIIVDGRWCWPVANSPDLIDLKRETENFLPPNISRADVLEWKHNGVKPFSAKEVWNSLRSHHPKVPWFSIVWFKTHVPRHSFVLWLAMKRKLATQDRLMSFGLLSRMSCYFCRGPWEDHDHLFFTCPFTARIWYAIMMDCGFQVTLSSWNDVVEWVLQHFCGSTLLSVIGKHAFAACVYVIWKERNKRKHENCYLDEVTTLRSIKTLVRLRVMSCSGFPKSDQNRHLVQHWNLPSSVLNT